MIGYGTSTDQARYLGFVLVLAAYTLTAFADPPVDKKERSDTINDNNGHLEYTTDAAQIKEGNDRIWRYHRTIKNLDGDKKCRVDWDQAINQFVNPQKSADSSGVYSHNPPHEADSELTYDGGTAPGSKTAKIKVFSPDGTLANGEADIRVVAIAIVRDLRISLVGTTSVKKIDSKYQVVYRLYASPAKSIPSDIRFVWFGINPDELDVKNGKVEHAKKGDEQSVIIALGENRQFGAETVSERPPVFVDRSLRIEDVSGVTIATIWFPTWAEKQSR